MHGETVKFLKSIILILYVENTGKFSFAALFLHTAFVPHKLRFLTFSDLTLIFPQKRVQFVMGVCLKCALCNK